MGVTKTYFMLMVGDMDRAVGFYEEALGLHAGLRTPSWSELSPPGSDSSADVVVALHAGGAGEGTEAGLGFEVDDLHEACRSVEKAGGRIVMPPEDRSGRGILRATAADTEGNRFSLTRTTTGS